MDSNKKQLKDIIKNLALYKDIDWAYLPLQEDDVLDRVLEETLKTLQEHSKQSPGTELVLLICLSVVSYVGYIVELEKNKQLRETIAKLKK